MTSGALKFAAARSLPLTALAKDDLRAALGVSFAVPNTTLSDVTSLSLPLRAGSNYLCEAWFISQQTVAPGILGVSFNFSGTTGGIGFNQSASISMTGASQTAGANFAATALVESAARAAAGGVFPTYMNALVGANTAGNLTVRAQRSAGTHTIYVGYISAREL